MPTIGCIGCGNMGTAIMGGFAKTLGKQWNLCACNRTEGKTRPLADLGVEILGDIASVAEAADILIFAVKPHQMDAVLRSASTSLRKGCTTISIAAGYGLERMRAVLGESIFLCRCMPTTTALVGQGIFAFCFADAEKYPDREKTVLDLFAQLGMCLEIPEQSFTAFSALIGAGPAYVFAFMQGLEQAGVTLGFPRAQCHDMITALFAGSAELARQRKKTFTELRDEVCSPGGLTIAGINVFDRKGLTGAIVDAVEAADSRGKAMEKN